MVRHLGYYPYCYSVVLLCHLVLHWHLGTSILRRHDVRLPYRIFRNPWIQSRTIR